MTTHREETGIIVKVLGGIYTVETSDGFFDCAARGVFRSMGISPCAGDSVRLAKEAGSFVIDEILPRKNAVIRPPLANLDCLVFVNSVCAPEPNLFLLDRFIAVAEYKGITPVIVFTKTDLDSPLPFSEIYRKAGFPVFELCALTGEGGEALAQLLDQPSKISAFTGNTGVGKSSLLNAIFGNLALNTGEVSRKLGRGKHTTRHVELFSTPRGGYVADTPGFSTFEIEKYSLIRKESLAGCFREFTPFTDGCRFHDCAHVCELGCAVIEAVRDGIVPAQRHESYVKMYEEAKRIKEWEHKA
ncbi:MAG: ribosome small subunit-dependent GTPase A [Oscillospiraceae bacterium]